MAIWSTCVCVKIERSIQNTISIAVSLLSKVGIEMELSCAHFSSCSCCAFNIAAFLGSPAV